MRDMLRMSLVGIAMLQESFSMIPLVATTADAPAAARRRETNPAEPKGRVDNGRWRPAEPAKTDHPMDSAHWKHASGCVAADFEPAVHPRAFRESRLRRMASSRASRANSCSARSQRYRHTPSEGAAEGMCDIFDFSWLPFRSVWSRGVPRHKGSSAL